jgi:hypothetical protein
MRVYGELKRFLDKSRVRALISFCRYVLPDHSLLRLIERPPTDMASLNSLFHSVPPIVRKRVQELLDVIRENAPPADGSVRAGPGVGEPQPSTETMENEPLQRQVASTAKLDILWSTCMELPGGHVSACSNNLFQRALL